MLVNLKNYKLPTMQIGCIGRFFYSPLRVNARTLTAMRLPEGGYLFMEGEPMKTMCFVRNKGQEACSNLFEVDTQSIEAEKRKAREDAEKFRQIVRNTRLRLGLEVSHA